VLESMSQEEGSTHVPPKTDRRRPVWAQSPVAAGSITLLLGVLAAAWTAIFHGWGRLSLPVSHVRGSDWDVQLTLVEACARMWSMGELPVWNPWTAGGVPLWANPEAPVFHPIAWAAMLAHPAAVSRVVLIGHMAIQVMGTALLARVLGARPMFLPITLVGLLTTDVLVWRMAHGHLMMAQAAWIPWAMALALGCRSPLRGGAAAAAVVALAVHGGGHYPAWIALASTSLLLVSTHAMSADRTHRHALTDLILRLGALGLLTGLLAAPRWLPTARALADTPRLRGPQAPLAMGDFSVLDGISAVFASAFGAAEAPGLHEGLPAWGTPLFALLAGGTVVLGVTRFVSARTRPRLLGAGLAVGVFAAVSLGHNFPGNPYHWLHSVPPLDRFRNPERWAMAWLPLMTALSTAGVSAVFTWVAPRVGWVRAVGPLVVLVLLGGHTWLSVEDTRAHTTIDQITTDTYAREPRTLPMVVRDPPRTNFEAAGHNESCLLCSDALLHEAPPDLPEGPFALPAPVELRSWRPDRVTFFVPIDPHADPRSPMDSEVVVPQAFRLGWTARDDKGQELRVTHDPAGTRVRVPTPGREVELTYALPGWTTGRNLGWLGVLLWVGAMRWRGRDDSLNASSAEARSTPVGG